MAVVLYNRPEYLVEASASIVFGTILTFIFFILSSALFDSETQIIIATSVGGFTILPILMVAYELAVAQTSHLGIGEGMSCGLINSLANLLGFFYVLCLTPLLDEKTQTASITAMYILLTSLAVAATLIAILLYIKRKKMN